MRLKNILSLVLVGMLSCMTAVAYNTYENTPNTTMYTPWFTMYHMQTSAEAEKSIRGGEGGQVIMSMGISKNADVMLFGTDTAGLWRSCDGGQNWLSVKGINMWSVSDIAFHPTEPDTVYIVQGMPDFTENSINKLNTSQKDGVYKSTDGGKTFVHVLEKQILGTFGSENLICYDASGNVYVLTNEGVFKSADGEEWTLLGNVCDTNTGLWSMAVSQDGQTILCATDQNSLSASFNGGVDWKNLTKDSLSGTVSSVVFKPGDESTIYITCRSGENKGVLEGEITGESISFTQLADPTAGQSKNVPSFLKFGATRQDGSATLYHVSDIMAYPLRVSNDYGRTWEGYALNTEDIFTYNVTGYQSEGLCVHPYNPDIVYYSFSDVIFKSSDGGKSFNYSCSGYSGNYSRNFRLDSQGRIWFPFMDKGVGRTDSEYKKDNPPTVKMLLTGGTAADIAFEPGNENHIITALGSWTTHTLKESFDGGETWSDITSAEAGSYGSIYWHKNGQVIYASTKISYDAGATWVTPDVDISTVSPVNNDVVYGTKDKIIYRSDDCGKTWSSLAQTSSPYVIRADEFDEKTVWVGCYDSTIVKIEDTNRTIFNTTNGLPATYTIAFNAIAQNPKDKNHLLAGGKDTLHGETAPGLFESRDGGKTWVNVPDMPSSGMIFAIEFMPDGKSALLGTYSGTIIYDHNAFSRYRQSEVGIYIGEKNERTKFASKEIYSFVNADGSTQLTVNGQNNLTYNLNSNTSTGEKASLYFEFDIPTAFYKEAAVLCIDTGKINAGGVFSIYSVTDTQWTEAFAHLENGIHTTQEAKLPPDESLIATSENYSYSESGSHSELDITQYVQSLSESGRRKARLHVVYNTNEKRTTDGARVCGMNYNDASKRVYINEAYYKTISALSGKDAVIRVIEQKGRELLSISGIYVDKAFQSAQMCRISGDMVHKISAQDLGKGSIKHFLLDKNLAPVQNMNEILPRKETYVTYNRNGGECSTTFAAYEGTPLTLPEATKPGNNFLGWYTAASGGVKIGDAGASYIPSEDIALYARWEKIPYTITVSTSNATVSGVKNGQTAYYGDIISFTVSYSQSSSQTTTVKDANGNNVTTTGNYSFTMPASNVTISASSNCIAPETLITLADGTQREVQYLKDGEELLVWNLNTGSYDTAPIVFNECDEESEYEIVHLYFSDGSDVEVIYEHGFFDVNLGKYVYLRSNNAKDYIGHKFVKQGNIGKNTWETVTLSNVIFEKKVTTPYSPVTFEHLCYYADGVLSMPGGIDGLFNIFEVDTDTMKYDTEKMCRDIESYGLFNYEDFKDLIPEYAYNAFNGKYLKVAISKGYITWDDILRLAERYGKYWN